MKVLSLLLLLSLLGCASSGANRRVTTADRGILSPADVQPPPLAAAIPGALRVPTVAQAPPNPFRRGPLLQHFERAVEVGPVFNREILPSRIDRVAILGCEALNFWTFTNLDEEAIYGLEVSIDGGKTWKRTEEWNVCSAPIGADRRLMLYLPGSTPPHPRLVPIQVPSTIVEEW